ncbi:MAG TPA: hypothetical protein VMW53_07390 [archaeon]|nr:hypothetical protein [archaeon]
MSSDILIDAIDEYEKLLEEAEEKGYEHGWIWHKLNEKYGEEIANQVYESDDEYEEW